MDLQTAVKIIKETNVPLPSEAIKIIGFLGEDNLIHCGCRCYMHKPPNERSYRSFFFDAWSGSMCSQSILRSEDSVPETLAQIVENQKKLQEIPFTPENAFAISSIINNTEGQLLSHYRLNNVTGVLRDWVQRQNKLMNDASAEVTKVLRDPLCSQVAHHMVIASSPDGPCAREFGYQELFERFPQIEDDLELLEEVVDIWVDAFTSGMVTSDERVRTVYDKLKERSYNLITLAHMPWSTPLKAETGESLAAWLRRVYQSMLHELIVAVDKILILRIEEDFNADKTLYYAYTKNAESRLPAPAACYFLANGVERQGSLVPVTGSATAAAFKNWGWDVVEATAPSMSRLIETAEVLSGSSLTTLEHLKTASKLESD